ncbi:MAG: flagellin [Balneolaceae bacterium]|nr:MAG: flagellin [Balneolaceae bacterium]
MSFGDLNRVNTNVQSMNSQFSLNKINRDLSNNQLRMSTGLRINRAEDDAAGYSIAAKLSSRIEGLDRAMQNVGDAKSVLDIAETGIDKMMDLLIEMKGKATQAANGTLGETERGFIADQISALAAEINEISEQSIFQDISLFGGTDGENTGALELTFQVGERSSDTLTVELTALNVSNLFAGAGAIDGIDAVPAAGAAEMGSLVFDTFDGDTFNAFIDVVDAAINTLAETVNEIGISQSKLSIREETLSTAITANSSARSRIQDADFAKEQSQSIRLQILQQTATAALAQANAGPQAVLSFIR